MKKTFLLPLMVACMMLLGSAVSAQSDATTKSQTEQSPMDKKVRLTPQQRMDNEVTKLDEIVKLTPEQKTQVTELMKTINAQKQQNKATANGDIDKIKELNRNVADQRNEGLKKILTPQQWLALKEAKKGKKEAGLNETK